MKCANPASLPSCVRFSHSGQANDLQVADFGLSRIFGESPIMTTDVGTVCYAAPELLTQGLLTKAADVYSFGAHQQQLRSAACPCGCMHEWSHVRQ